MGDPLERYGDDQSPMNFDRWFDKVNDEFSKMESIPKHELQPPKGRKSTIHRLPAYLREKLHPHHYKPREVQFGLYHARNKYSRWRQIKDRVLLYFLKRSNRPLDDYLGALREVVHDLKDAYDELAPDHWLLDEQVFLMVMIQDGCFLLEILRELSNLNEANYHRSDYNSDSPLWDVDGISRSELIEYYKHDMLLLENQLPMLLLVRLLNVQTDATDINIAQVDINWYILWIFFPALRIGRIRCKCKYLHVLDLYRHILVYQEHREHFDSHPESIRIKVDPEFNFNIPSATDLKDAGIRITRIRSKSLVDISIRNGNLELPQIYIDGATRSRFINIIAFEQLHDDATTEFTSYVYFMSGLLKGANDVRILCVILILFSSQSTVEWVKV